MANTNLNTPAQPSLDEAYAFCAHMAQSHYENFPVGSILIPKKIRPHVHAIYAFARTADDFADEPGLKKHERLTELGRWEGHLKSCTQNPQGPIFVALAHTIQTQDIPVELLSDLLTAFRMDVTHNRHQTLPDLLNYCIYSANPIGRLILHLFGYRQEHLARLSDAICSGLQLANFWQDIGIDHTRNRIYLPLEEMANFGVTEDILAGQTTTPELRKLLAHLCQLTRDLFQQGKPLLNQVHGRLKYELRLTWLGGTTILNKLEAGNFDIFRHRPKIGKRDLPLLLMKTVSPFGWHHA